MRTLISILLIFLFHANLFSQGKEVVVPYTLADRERLVRVEMRLDNIDDRIDNLDKRMDGLDKRMDRLEIGIQEVRNAIWSLFYAMIGLIGVFCRVGLGQEENTVSCDVTHG